jgi:hypothetical protein
VVIGTRGVVAYELSATVSRPNFDPDLDNVDVSARAQALARRAAGGWTDWLESQRAAQHW